MKTTKAIPNPQPLTDTERSYIEKLIRDNGGRRSIRAQACWRNAQNLILADDEKRLRYWERGLPIPHAWVTINNKVVDVTFDAVARKLKRMGTSMTAVGSHEYRGVIVNRQAVLRHVLTEGIFGPVLEISNEFHMGLRPTHRDESALPRFH